MNRRIIMLSMLLSVFFVHNGYAHFEQIIVDGKKNVKFTTRVDRLGQQTPDNEFFSGKAADTTVEHTLPGEVYQQPVELTAVAEGEVNRSTPIDALRSFYSSNLTGDLQWIADDFIESEREYMSLLAQHPDMLQKNTERFAEMQRIKVLGFTDYESYKIFFVQEVFKDSVQTVPVVLINVNGQWLRTNALHADKVFDVIFSSLSS